MLILQHMTMDDLFALVAIFRQRIDAGHGHFSAARHKLDQQRSLALKLKEGFTKSQLLDVDTLGLSDGLDDQKCKGANSLRTHLQYRRRWQRCYGLLY